MLAGVLRETLPGETRVALVPALLPALAKAGIEVAVEVGAGEAAGIPDSEFAEKGAKLVTVDELLERASLLLTVRSFAGTSPTSLAARLRKDQILIGLLDPFGAPAGVATLAAQGVAAFALELVPRITRAQSMDALSSMATIVGYKAVLLAADALPRLFPMLTTAAGTIAPARVFVMGAGVAGLQAIATARRLGAVVEAYDLRPAVREQVQSLGAKFIELPLEAQDAQDSGGYARAMGEDFYRRQREMLARIVVASDVVITSAAVPGKKAPVLLTVEMVDGMRRGSVIVDLAAEQGGNCELTERGSTVVHGGVRIFGPENLAASVPFHASQLFAKNIANFVANATSQGEFQLDAADEIVRDSIVTRSGQVVHPRVREALGLAPLVASAPV